jgi:hypothetical protein
MCGATVRWYGALQGVVVEKCSMHGYGTVRHYCTSIMTEWNCTYGSLRRSNTLRICRIPNPSHKRFRTKRRQRLGALERCDNPSGCESTSPFVNNGHPGSRKKKLYSNGHPVY